MEEYIFSIFLFDRFIYHYKTSKSYIKNVFENKLNNLIYTK